MTPLPANLAEHTTGTPLTILGFIFKTDLSMESCVCVLLSHVPGGMDRAVPETTRPSLCGPVLSSLSGGPRPDKPTTIDKHLTKVDSNPEVVDFFKRGLRFLQKGSPLGLSPKSKARTQLGTGQTFFFSLKAFGLLSPTFSQRSVPSGACIRLSLKAVRVRSSSLIDPPVGRSRQLHGARIASIHEALKVAPV